MTVERSFVFYLLQLIFWYSFLPINQLSFGLQYKQSYFHNHYYKYEAIELFLQGFRDI